MGKKKIECLLPPLSQQVEKIEPIWYDAEIIDAYTGVPETMRSYRTKEPQVLIVSFYGIVGDDEPRDEDGNIDDTHPSYVHKDDDGRVEIKVDTTSGSPYSQLIQAAFYGDDLPTIEFSPKSLIRKFVRFEIVNGEIRTVEPYINFTNMQREFYDL